MKLLQQMIDAIKNQKADAFIEVLNQAKENISQLDESGEEGVTPLVCAMMSNTRLGLEMMEFLLLAGCNPNKVSRSLGCTPLLYAVQNNNIRAIEHLLKYNVNVNQLIDSIHGSTALIAAISLNHKDAVNLLLAHGADPNLCYLGSTTYKYRLASALAVAARRNQVDIIIALIKHKANINGMNGEVLPLYQAAHHNAYNAMQVLIQHGARCDQNVGEEIKNLIKDGYAEALSCLLQSARPSVQELKEYRDYARYLQRPHYKRIDRVLSYPRLNIVNHSDNPTYLICASLLDLGIGVDFANKRLAALQERPINKFTHEFVQEFIAVLKDDIINRANNVDPDIYNAHALVLYMYDLALILLRHIQSNDYNTTKRLLTTIDEYLRHSSKEPAFLTSTSGAATISQHLFLYAQAASSVQMILRHALCELNDCVTAVDCIKITDTVMHAKVLTSFKKLHDSLGLFGQLDRWFKRYLHSEALPTSSELCRDIKKSLNTAINQLEITAQPIETKVHKKSKKKKKAKSAISTADQKKQKVVLDAAAAEIKRQKQEAIQRKKEEQLAKRKKAEEENAIRKKERALEKANNKKQRRVAKQIDEVDEILKIDVDNFSQFLASDHHVPALESYIFNNNVFDININANHISIGDRLAKKFELFGDFQNKVYLTGLAVLDECSASDSLKIPAESYQFIGEVNPEQIPLKWGNINIDGAVRSFTERPYIDYRNAHNFDLNYHESLSRQITLTRVYVDNQGRVYDPCGRGWDDLINKRIHINNPEQTLSNNPSVLFSILRVMAKVSGAVVSDELKRALHKIDFLLIQFKPDDRHAEFMREYNQYIAYAKIKNIDVGAQLKSIGLSDKLKLIQYVPTLFFTPARYDSSGNTPPVTRAIQKNNK